MSYAIRNDQQGWRAVNGPDDCGPSEYFSETPIEIVPIAPTREEVELTRLRAYADPLTGSDRFFAEAVRLQAMGADQDEIDAAKAAGVARYEQIQAERPWP